MTTANIYTVTYHRYDKTKNAISKIFESLQNQETLSNLYIIDNNSDDQTKQWLKHFCENRRIFLTILNDNIGKSRAMNFAHSIAQKSDYVINIDSDIYPKPNDRWLDKLIDAMESFPELKVLAPDLEENNPHLKNKLSKSYHSQGKIQHYNFIHERQSEGGIGGGVLCFKTETFDKLNGYNAPDIYAGDDGDIISRCSKAAVCESIVMIHPYETDEEKDYALWKRNRIKDRNTWTLENNKGFFDG